MRVQLFTVVLQEESSDLIHANNMFSMTLSGGEYARHLHINNGYGPQVIGGIIEGSIEGDDYVILKSFMTANGPCPVAEPLSIEIVNSYLKKFEACKNVNISPVVTISVPRDVPSAQRPLSMVNQSNKSITDFKLGAQ